MNEHLRSHVTRTGFNLELGKLHLFHLVRLDLGYGVERRPSAPWYWYHDQFIRAYRGLDARGLLTGTRTISPAGYLVIGLLKESGLYDEYASAWQEKAAS